MRAFDPQHTPQVLHPARVNPKRLFLTGAACWLVALATLGVMRLAGHHPDPRLLPMCLVGLGLGAVGWAWAHWTQKEQPDQ